MVCNSLRLSFRMKSSPSKISTIRRNYKGYRIWIKTFPVATPSCSAKNCRFSRLFYDDYRIAIQIKARLIFNNVYYSYSKSFVSGLHLSQSEMWFLSLSCLYYIISEFLYEKLRTIKNGFVWKSFWNFLSRLLPLMI